MLSDVLEVFMITLLSIIAVMIVVFLSYEIGKDIIEYFNDKRKLKENRYSIRKTLD